MWRRRRPPAAGAGAPRACLGDGRHDAHSSGSPPRKPGGSPGSTAPPGLRHTLLTVASACHVPACTDSTHAAVLFPRPVLSTPLHHAPPRLEPSTTLHLTMAFPVLTCMWPHQAYQASLRAVSTCFYVATLARTACRVVSVRSHKQEAVSCCLHSCRSSREAAGSGRAAAPVCGGHGRG